jgi:hypothetical protein
MATTTTWHAIRDNWSTLIEAVTPDDLVNVPFRRAPRHLEIRNWAVNAGSAAARKFQFRRGDPGDEPEVQDPSVLERMEITRLTIAYPVLVGLYGTDDLNDLECLMRDDASRVREVLLSGSAYLAGHSLGWPTIAEPDRELDGVWFQDFDIEMRFVEAQTLT